jgi:hypothetical protein
VLPKGIGFSRDFAVGEILSHFKEHVAESKGNIDFLEFLSLHYSSDSDHREHNPDSLPVLDGKILATFLNITPAFSEAFSFIEVSEYIEKMPSNYQNSYNFDFSQNLLHPPRG